MTAMIYKDDDVMVSNASRGFVCVGTMITRPLSMIKRPPSTITSVAICSSAYDYNVGWKTNVHTQRKYLSVSRAARDTISAKSIVWSERLRRCGPHYQNGLFVANTRVTPRGIKIESNDPTPPCFHIIHHRTLYCNLNVEALGFPTRVQLEVGSAQWLIPL